MSQPSSSYKKAAWRRFRKNPLALTGLVIIIISMLLAISAYLVAPDGSPNANRQIVEIGGQTPGNSFSFLLLRKERPVESKGFLNRLISGKEDSYHYIPITSHQFKGDSIVIEAYRDEGLTETLSYPITALAPTPVVTQTFWLGTDKFGRDILSRIILGTRISLSVGLITVIISLSIGLLLGSLAGYFKGRTDSIIMWLINVIWSIPTLLLVFAITLALGRGFWQVFIAVGFTMWVNVARLVRGQVMAMRELEFVEAAKALGYSHMRTIVKHIWPNIMGPVIVIAASNFASAIVIEAGLSFLGIGVQPPQPSWGLMIKENYNYIITQNPVLALAPGVAIMLLVLAFNLVGNGLRDALNVR